MTGRNPRFVIVRGFRIADGRSEDFEKVYGRTGLWIELFKKSEGFLDSILECQSETERQFQLKIFWKSHLDFEGFNEHYKTECERLQKLVELEGLVEKEFLLGSFYVGGQDSEEGTDLIPA